jgi:hypothetical protein
VSSPRPIEAAASFSTGNALSILTNIKRWLRHRAAERETFPDEFRRERMDAGWRPE